MTGIPPNIGSADSLRSDGARLGIIALCVLALMLDGVDIQMMAFSAPAVLQELGIEKVALAPALAAALAGMTVGSVLGGVLGDRWGRRPVILLSLVWAGVFTVVCGTSGSVGEVVLWRFMGGWGFGALYPNIFALIAEMAPARLLQRIVVISSVGTPLGGVAGALLCSWALPLHGWRVCFYAAGVATLLVAAAIWAMAPESPSFLVARAVPSTGASDAGRRHSLGLLFAPGFTRRTIGLCLIAGSLGYVGYAFLHWVPSILSAAGLPLASAIRGAFFVNASTIVGTFAMAAFVGWLGTRASFLCALAVFAGGAAILPSVVAVQSEIGMTAALIGVGFGTGMAASCLFLLGVEAYPPDRRSSGGGLTGAIGRLGAMGVAFGGAASLAGGSDIAPFSIMALLGLALAALGVFIVNSHGGKRANGLADSTKETAR